MYLTTAIICIIIVAIVAAFLVFGNLFVNEEKGIVVSNTSIPKSESSVANSEEVSIDTPKSIIDVAGYKEISVQNSTLSDGDLILITNKAYSTAPDQAAIELTDLYSKKLKGIYSLTTAMSLVDTDAFNAFNKMMQDFYNATNESHVEVNAAYMSLAKLKEDEMLTTYADLASGRALKLRVFPSENGKMGEGVFLWLTEHCDEYGYILRYPADKTEQTGVEPSASLFRYVGVTHSKYMKANNLTLDEYINLLKKYTYEKPLIYTDVVSGEVYRIYYEAISLEASTKLYVPSDMAYSVSGNNVDGFIVTVSVNTAVASE